MANSGSACCTEEEFFAVEVNQTGLVNSCSCFRFWEPRQFNNFAVPSAVPMYVCCVPCVVLSFLLSPVPPLFILNWGQRGVAAGV